MSRNGCVIFLRKGKQVQGSLCCGQFQMFGLRIVQDTNGILSKSILFQTLILVQQIWSSHVSQRHFATSTIGNIIIASTSVPHH
nr:hypothetical protein CFP56_59966 [Quercus suber]